MLDVEELAEVVVLLEDSLSVVELLSVLGSFFDLCLDPNFRDNFSLNLPNPEESEVAVAVRAEGRLESRFCLCTIMNKIPCHRNFRVTQNRKLSQGGSD